MKENRIMTFHNLSFASNVPADVLNSLIAPLNTFTKPTKPHSKLDCN